MSSWQHSARTLVLLLALIQGAGLAALRAEMPTFGLPTKNEAIFASRPQDFFMFVDRHFEGVASQPWQAGSYGFVRNMKRLSPNEVIGTRFHEGVDIKPLRRDKSGEPLDAILSTAPGEVVYINQGASRSNYGKYLVVLHNWGEGEIYSLYAHLSRISVSKGQRVQRGEKLGEMGYTGAGLNRRRAHLHFELGLVLSTDFDRWYGQGKQLASGHGNYHGRNLVGLDAVALFRAQRAGTVRSLASFLRGQKPYYALTFPRREDIAFLKRYPWLLDAAQKASQSPSLEMSFSASGLPLFIKASRRKVQKPTITSLQQIIGFHQDRTQKRITGRGNTAKLSASGKRYLALILGEY